MKLLSIENSNAENGYKLVTIQLTLENQVIDVRYFVNFKTGQIEAHKSTNSSLGRQIENFIQLNLHELDDSQVEMEKNKEIASLEKRLAELRKS